MRWISADGGPLVVMEPHLATHWRGTDGLSATSKFQSDYWRACAIKEFIGVISVGPGQALVLGDEPDATTWRPGSGSVEGDLVRWVAAESEDDILQSLGAMAQINTHEDHIEYAISEGNLILFGAAWSGVDRTKLRLEICVTGKKFHVYTRHCRPFKGPEYIVHRFLRVPLGWSEAAGNLKETRGQSSE